jgi:ATP-dependent helicase/nuclease subunit A
MAALMSEALTLLPESVQRIASDPMVSSWVGASAGSGKTKVLTDRILRLLLLDDIRFPSILAITFTNAAAAEMANRLNDVLAFWATAGDGELNRALDDLLGPGPRDTAIFSRARSLFTRSIDAATGVRIMTIHGFCQSVLRRFPIEAKLPPQFTVLDERSAGETLRLAVATVLQRAVDQPGSPLAGIVRRISVDFAEGRFSELVNEIVAERGRFQMLFADETPIASIVARMRASLGIPEGCTPQSIRRDACADGAFDRAGLEAATSIMLAEGTEKSDKPYAEIIRAWLRMEPAAREVDFDLYLEPFLTRSGQLRVDPMTKKLAARYPDARATLDREAERVREAVDRAQTAGLLDSSEDLLLLAHALLEEYELRKRAAAEVDYEDLILRTRDLLHPASEAAWVHFKLDGGIDHVLLDESQDTNPEQWDLVKSLVSEFFVGEGAVTRHRTLFAVGDSKQSIFSFQRADPAIFSRMRAHFETTISDARKRWEPVELDFSFRSTAPILQFVDRVFAPEAVWSGVAEHAPHHICRREGQGGLVELWPLIERDETPERDVWSAEPQGNALDPVRIAATRIADCIRGWLANGEILASENRPVRPGDILVLVRKRTSFMAALVKALKQLDIPVAGVDRMVLTRELPVADLMALGQVLLLPEDDLTLAILLRSPLVGFSDEQLFEIAWQRKGSLWEALEASGEPWAVAAIEWLAFWLGRADYVAPYELFTGILNKPCPADAMGSGRRAMVSRLGPEALDPLDEFLSAALTFEGLHPPSLEAFLGWLREDDVTIKREAMKAGDQGEVTIMTAHGAKGLQAPIVFLADGGSAQPSRGKPFVLWHDPEDGEPVTPLWAPCKGAEDTNCRAKRDELKRRADEEYRRLLYVALTRPKDRLYVVGWQAGARKVPDGCWYRLAESAMKTVGSEVEEGKWRLSVEQTAPVKAEKGRSSAPALSSSPAWLRENPPSESRPPRPLAPSRLVEEESILSPLQHSDGLTRFERGRLIHRLLQTLPDLPAARRREAALRYLAGAASLEAAQTEDIVAETLRLLDDPRFGFVFGPGSVAEVPVAGLIRLSDGPVVLSGQIDRLAVTDAEVTIVDFKTNRPPPQGQEGIPEAYRRQMAAYREAVAPLYPGRRIRTVILWTHGPFFTEVEGSVA